MDERYFRNINNGQQTKTVFPQDIIRWNTQKIAWMNNSVPSNPVTKCTKCYGRGYYANVNREGYIVALHCRCMDEILSKAKDKSK